jgi:hypothetical protein
VTGSHDAEEPPGPRTGVAALVSLSAVAACAGAAAAFYAVARMLRAQNAGFWAVMASCVAFAAIILTIVYVANRLRVRLARTQCSPAAARFRRRQFLAMIVYVALLFTAIGVHLRLPGPGPLLYIAAVLPGLPLIGLIAAMGLYLREETDEFERTVQVESALWATGAVLAITSIWGFMEMFALAPHVDSWVVFPAWSVLLGLSGALIRRRYR